ncbi:MFS transporter [Furfurilactobacillus curtus]|uniref:MFS transporter n=1 Tax=Furfurilactobacillus curtus TaxID=1746200 RepID=A0ABQ5JLD5_9LACO
MGRTLSINRIVIMAFLVNTIYCMVWPLSTVYLTGEFKLKLSVVGIVLLVYSCLNALGSAIAGRLFDRKNPFIVLMLGLLGLTGSVFIGLMWRGAIGYIVFLMPFGFTTGWVLTVQYALVSYMDHDKNSKRDFNLLYLGVNVGLVVGAGALGALYHGHGLVLLMSVILMFVVTLILVASLFLPVRFENVEHEAIVTAPVEDLHREHNSHIVIRMMISLFAIWLSYSQWMSNFSVYFLTIGLTTSFYSQLWIVNGIGIILVQTLLLKFPKVFKKTLSQAEFGVTFLCLSFLVLLLGKSESLIIISMTLLTIGEALFVPAAPVVVDEYTALVNKGRNQGLVNVFSSLGKASGPAIGGMIIERSGYKNLFVFAEVILVSAFVLIEIRTKRHSQNGFIK